jgi:NAD(P)-dependent dehydrogenase (short-subunit alcohol dehydrogenase family)
MAAGRLAGQAAIVTGAASGIGRAIALLFVQEGAQVLAVDRAAALLGELPASAALRTMAQDVTADGAARAMVDAALAAFGRLDIVVNNAGKGPPTPLAQTSDAEWDRWLALNLTSAFRLCRDAHAALAATGGCILNITSTLGLRGYPGHGAYSAAKAGMVGMTRNAATDYAADGIRVNASGNRAGTPEIVVGDHRVAGQIGRCTLVHHTPLLQHGRAVRGGQRQPGVLLHQQDRQALLVERCSALNTCLTITGARPRLGSSSSSSRGAPISARPIASICCCPPDSEPAAGCAAP